ncbi:hypothetical protein V3C99_000438 [Haemonchus contortus]
MTSLLFLVVNLLQIWLVSSGLPMLHLGHPMLSKERNNHNETIVSQGGFAGRETYFKQKLDHFDEKGKATWSQRYFYNKRYFPKGGDVVFLMLGGMGVLEVDWVTNERLPFVQWAKERGALMFALEHRFYGKSRPTADLSVKNLEYLTSQQAIEDIATFIKAMNDKHGLKNAKWIVFGGSYAGSLALWARQEHPALIAGAVASSPLMQPKFDFWEATQFTEDVYRAFDPRCAENIGIAFEQFTEMLGSDRGRKQISEMLNTEPHNWVAEHRNIQLLTSILLNNFILATQFRGGPFMQNGTSLYNTKIVCGLINDESSPQIEALKIINGMRVLQSKYMRDMPKTTPAEYDQLMRYLLKKDFDADDWASVDRASLWQRCTELGTFPTTDGAVNSIFGSLVSIDFYADLCQVFGKEFDTEYIEKAVEETIEFYGGADGYKGTNVVIANGGADPLLPLSKTSSDDPTVVTYVVEDEQPKEPSKVPKKTKVVKKIGLDDIKHPLEGLRSAFKRTKQQRPRNTTRLTPEQVSILRRVRLGRPPHGFFPNPDVLPDMPEEYEAGYFTQPVDHFDNKNPNTFDQKYYKNEQWAKPYGPNFLMIGGESPRHPSWVLNENLTYLTWAKEFGATVYLLEHRYYGDSDLLHLYDENKSEEAYTTYLSSLQMLYDVANFIRTVDAETDKPRKWIVFGGSYAGERFLGPAWMYVHVCLWVYVYVCMYVYVYLYAYVCKCGRWWCCFKQRIITHMSPVHIQPPQPTKPSITPGSLALWMRKLFPELVDGAIGSSAPLEAKLDFHEYYQVVEKSIRGYSEDCAYAIAEGYAFGYGIKEMCDIMTKQGRKPIMSIVAFNEYMTNFYTGNEEYEGTFNNYKFFTELLYEAQFADSPDDAAATLWLWQTCTEFGFYQTTDAGYTLFGNLLPLNFYTQLCSDVFGEKLEYATENNRQATIDVNNRYGGRHDYKATKVVMTHGSLDPWKALGNVTCNNSDKCFMIEGTAHCAEMYPAREDDVKALTDTREAIKRILKSWLKKRDSNDEENVEKREPSDKIDTSSPPAPIAPVEPSNEIKEPQVSAEKDPKKKSAGSMATNVLISSITAVVFLERAFLY